MKRMVALLFLLLNAPHAFSSYFVLDTGYRYDSINEERVLEDTTAATTNLSTLRELRNLQGVTLGGRGILSPSCTSFFLQAAGHFTWITSGGYNVDNILKARSKGHAWDGTAGLGFCFCMNDSFSIAPLVGGSYDSQVLRINHSRTGSPVQDLPDADHATWKSTWFGPWAGFSVFFESCRCIPAEFDLGYEFHYGWSHMSWRQKANLPANGTFNYFNNLNNMLGHVFHAEGLIPLCNSWVFGLRVQYTYWNNMHIERAHVPPPAETGLTSTQFFSTRILDWRSVSATAQIGFCF